MTLPSSFPKGGLKVFILQCILKNVGSKVITVLHVYCMWWEDNYMYVAVLRKSQDVHSLVF